MLPLMGSDIIDNNDYYRLRSEMTKYAAGRKVLRGYKVCSYDEETLDLTSAIWGDLKYDIGHITIPGKNNGPVCVFGHYDKAKRFYDKLSEKGYSMYNIFRCLYIRSIENCVWSMIPGYEWFEKFEIHLLNPGTVLADAVMLTMQVDDT